MTDMQEPNIENTVPTRPHQDIEETVPTNVKLSTPETPVNLESTQPVPVPPQKASRPRRWPWVILGFFLIILFSAAGGWLGYRAAAQIRKQNYEESRVSQASEHFMAGLVAQQNKQYEIARIQFEHVIQLDPSFPGAQDKLREVMIEMAMAMTPTPAPTVVTPTLTPTLDTRPQDEIYNQARQLYAAKDWNNLFATIDSLRRIDPKFKAVELDGMLYVAFRFRGIDKIIHTANLEGGLYDLALAGQYAPLDVDSLGYQNWARMYLNGASFWQIDWIKVMNYFEQIYPYFPNMRDSSGITAIERYRIAARSQGDKLETQGDHCGALEFYKKSLQAVPDQTLEKKVTEVYLLCYPPTPVSTVTPTVTPTTNAPLPENTITPTVPEVEPTAEPTAEPTVEPTAEPTAEPTTQTNP